METNVDILSKVEAEELRERVRARYSKSAVQVMEGGGSCCGGSGAGADCCSGNAADPSQQAYIQVRRLRRFPPRRCSHRLDVAIRPRWRG